MFPRAITPRLDTFAAGSRASRLSGMAALLPGAEGEAVP